MEIRGDYCNRSRRLTNKDCIIISPDTPSHLFKINFDHETQEIKLQFEWILGTSLAQWHVKIMNKLTLLTSEVKSWTQRGRVEFVKMHRKEMLCKLIGGKVSRDVAPARLSQLWFNLDANLMTLLRRQTNLIFIWVRLEFIIVYVFTSHPFR